MMKGKCHGSKGGWILVLIGALNWGLVGVGEFLDQNWNVINLILGRADWLESLVYVVIGIAGLILLFGCKCSKCKDKNCKSCESGTCETH